MAMNDPVQNNSSLYIPTIGLEIHTELRTQTKMFCHSKNDTNETKPNTNICPICLGYPGTLPTINKEAVRHVLRLGVAVGGKIADYTEFDRKNYFYPDIPKGYQISQYKFPLVSGGNLAGVELTRVHLEEDTAKSLHGSNLQFPISNFQSSPNDSISNENSNIENSMKIAKLKTENYSLIDFNRAGVPLMELVTEPVIHDAETAGKFAKEFKLLLQYLGASEANMEKGEMRVEANISVSKLADVAGRPILGTKVEVKNLNSFRAMEKAIKYEIERHREILERGEKVVQETRGWDENKGETFSQRAKEDSHDYRYFPDPDLPKLFINEIPEFSLEALKESLPELPEQERDNLKKIGLVDEHIEIYIKDKELREYIKGIGKTSNNLELTRLASNYLIENTELSKLPMVSLQHVMELLIVGKLSSLNARKLLKLVLETGKDPDEIIKSEGLLQQSDPEGLKKIAVEIISNNPVAVEEYKKGKTASLQFLVGQGMKESKGSANPQILKEIFSSLLDA